MVIAARVTVGIAAAGIASFALLYAPQSVLPQLAADFRLDPGGASLAIGVATGALAVAVLPVAALSEVVGRRRIILVSVVASVVLGLLLPLAPTFETLLVLRALQGIAIAGFPGVAAAYLMDLLGGAGVAAAVGAMIAGNSVGGMAGRLAAGLVAEPLGWHGALAAVAGLSAVCAVVTVLTLPPAPVRPRVRRGGGLRAAFSRPVLLAQYGVAAAGVGAFVAVYNAAGFRLIHELGLAPAIASLVFLAYAMGTLSSSTAGRLVGRYGKRPVLVAALLVTVLGTLLTIPDNLVLVVIGLIVLTGGFFAAHAVANGWAAAQAPEGARGHVSGVYTLFFYVGSSAGGTLGSIVYGKAGWNWLVVVTAAWLLAAMAGVLTEGRRRRDHQRHGVGRERARTTGGGRQTALPGWHTRGDSRRAA
ncbi:MFS transporter [Nonomuraea sp. NPDC059194]|uniref:MFS transporter n=1 Tax=Nonomuraea sp. NPDC059194 TaxID=3346764 RepID=UPI0036C8C533